VAGVAHHHCYYGGHQLWQA